MSAAGDGEPQGAVTLDDVFPLMHALMLADDECVRYAMDNEAALALRGAHGDKPPHIAWKRGMPLTNETKSAIFKLQALIRDIPELQAPPDGKGPMHWNAFSGVSAQPKSATLRALFWSEWLKTDERRAAKALVARRLAEAEALEDGVSRRSGT